MIPLPKVFEITSSSKEGAWSVKSVNGCNSLSKDGPLLLLISVSVLNISVHVHDHVIQGVTHVTQYVQLHLKKNKIHTVTVQLYYLLAIHNN